MKREKAQKKLSGSVKAYLAHKGVACELDPSFTFAMLSALSDACEPMCMESAEARELAYARLAVLEEATSEKPAADPLEEKARSLINPAAVRVYATKRGRGYRDYVKHKTEHPRGKSPEELAECYMKLGEIDIAQKGLTGEAAERVRAQALTNAKMCLLACRG